jgi:hypothetical protein
VGTEDVLGIKPRALYIISYTPTLRIISVFNGGLLSQLVVILTK